MMDPFVPQLPRLLWGLGQEVCGGVGWRCEGVGCCWWEEELA